MADYTDPNHDRRAPEAPGWHLDKKVPISLILTIVMLAVAGMSAYSDLQREIALMQSDISTLKKADDRQATDLKDALGSMQSQLNRMEANLYRLIERSPK